MGYARIPCCCPSDDGDPGTAIEEFCVDDELPATMIWRATTNITPPIIEAATASHQEPYPCYGSTSNCEVLRYRNVAILTQSITIPNTSGFDASIRGWGGRIISAYIPHNPSIYKLSTFPTGPGSRPDANLIPWTEPYLGFSGVVAGSVAELYLSPSGPNYADSAFTNDLYCQVAEYAHGIASGFDIIADIGEVIISPTTDSFGSPYTTYNSGGYTRYAGYPLPAISSSSPGGAFYRPAGTSPWGGDNAVGGAIKCPSGPSFITGTILYKPPKAYSEITVSGAGAISGSPIVVDNDSTLSPVYYVQINITGSWDGPGDPRIANISGRTSKVSSECISSVGNGAALYPTYCGGGLSPTANPLYVPFFNSVAEWGATY